MVLDSSALVAIVLGEPDAQLYIDAISSAINRTAGIYLPASVLFEAGAVLDRRGRGQDLDALLDALQPEVVAIDGAVAKKARTAFQKFGRGMHQAKLNFGDCLSYAVCKHLGETLLFKGNDFTHTDLAFAI